MQPGSSLREVSEVSLRTDKQLPGHRGIPISLSGLYHPSGTATISQASLQELWSLLPFERGKVCEYDTNAFGLEFRLGPRHPGSSRSSPPPPMNLNVIIFHSLGLALVIDCDDFVTFYLVGTGTTVFCGLHQTMMCIYDYAIFGAPSRIMN